MSVDEFRFVLDSGIEFLQRLLVAAERAERETMVEQNLR
jgi:hypothetical protein